MASGLPLSSRRRAHPPRYGDSPAYRHRRQHTPLGAPSRRDGNGRQPAQRSRRLRGDGEERPSRQVDRGRRPGASPTPPMRGLGHRDPAEDPNAALACHHVLNVRIGSGTGVYRLGRRWRARSSAQPGRPAAVSRHGAQILVSGATAAACAGRLAGGVGLRDLGSFLMRGFDSPIRVHQAEATGLVDSFPPLRAPSPASTASPQRVRPVRSRGDHRRAPRPALEPSTRDPVGPRRGSGKRASPRGRPSSPPPVRRRNVVRRSRPRHRR